MTSYEKLQLKLERAKDIGFIFIEKAYPGTEKLFNEHNTTEIMKMRTNNQITGAQAEAVYWWEQLKTL